MINVWGRQKKWLEQKGIVMACWTWIRSGIRRKQSGLAEIWSVVYTIIRSILDAAHSRLDIRKESQTGLCRGQDADITSTPAVTLSLPDKNKWDSPPCQATSEGQPPSSKIMSFSTWQLCFLQVKPGYTTIPSKQWNLGGLLRLAGLGITRTGEIWLA